MIRHFLKVMKSVVGARITKEMQSLYFVCSRDNMANVGVVLDFRGIGKGHVLCVSLVRRKLLVEGASITTKCKWQNRCLFRRIILFKTQFVYNFLYSDMFFLQTLDFKRFEKLSFHVENIARTLYRD